MHTYLFGAYSYVNFVGFLLFVLLALGVLLAHTSIAWLLASKSTIVSLNRNTSDMVSFNLVFTDIALKN